MSSFSPLVFPAVAPKTPSLKSRSIKSQQRQQKKMEVNPPPVMNSVITWILAWLNRHLFSLTLSATAIIQLIIVGILYTYYTSWSEQKSTLILFVTLMTILQWIIVSYAFGVLCRHMWLTDVLPPIFMYLSTIIAFGGLYFYLFLLWQSSFDYPSFAENNTYWDQAVVFFMYSCSVQALSGVSGVVPLCLLTQIASVIQMIVGLSYFVVLLTICLSRFSEIDKVVNDASLPSVDRWLKKRLHFPQFFRFMLPIVIAVTVVKCILFAFVLSQGNTFHVNHSQRVGAAIYLAMDLTFLISALISIGFELFDIASHNSKTVNISLSHLLGAVLSIFFLFGVCYVDMYFIDPNTTPPAFQINPLVTTPDENEWFRNYFIMIGHMIYFSISTVSGVGVSSPVIPVWATAQLLVSIQLIIGALLHCVAFAVVLLSLGNRRDTELQKWIAILRRMNAKSIVTLNSAIESELCIEMMDPLIDTIDTRTAIANAGDNSVTPNQPMYGTFQDLQAQVQFAPELHPRMVREIMRKEVALTKRRRSISSRDDMKVTPFRTGSAIVSSGFTIPAMSNEMILDDLPTDSRSNLMHPIDEKDETESHSPSKH